MILLIVKPLDVSLILLQTEALDKRLPQHHKMKELVSNDARRLRAGYNGEKSLGFTLSLLDNSTYYILHNLRIPDTNGFFQIDNLILTKNLCVLIEVKNIFGTVTFDEMGQMIRSHNDIEEGFRSPIEQIVKQEYRFKRWLKANKFPTIPIEKLVVFSNSSTIIRNMTSNRYFGNLVIHEDKLFSRLIQFEERYQEPTLSIRQIKRVIKKLLEQHASQLVDILEKYTISYNDLIKGVFCEHCKEIMNRDHGKWKCGGCGWVSNEVYLNALRDYSILIKGDIKNREARDFLNVNSYDVVKQLLKQGGFEKVGTTSDTRYKLEF